MRYDKLLLLLSTLVASTFADEKVQVHVKQPETSAFNPRQYEKSFAKNVMCSTINRNGMKGEPKKVDIKLRYLDINRTTSGRTLLMVHGWPGLWTSWSPQIPHFENSYRLLVVDQRGFGGSTHPGDVQASGSMADFVSDLICVLDQAGVEKAVCVGHDWGSQVCWEAARMRPDRFEGVAGAVVPYLPSAGPFTPVEHLSKALPHLTYQIYFEKQTDKAVAELNTDIRRTLRSVLRTVDSPPPEGFLTSKSSFLKAYRDHPIIDPPPFYSKQEEDYLVEQYEKQGFNYTLQFYTYHNRHQSWELPNSVQKNHTIPQPALLILPVSDPVADWPLAALILQSSKFVPHLTTKAMNTAHWPQLEQPAIFNDILEDWLEDLDVKLGEADVAKKMKELEAARKALFQARRKKRDNEWAKWVETASDRVITTLPIEKPKETGKAGTKQNHNEL